MASIQPNENCSPGAYSKEVSQFQRQILHFDDVHCVIAAAKHVSMLTLASSSTHIMPNVSNNVMSCINNPHDETLLHDIQLRLLNHCGTVGKNPPKTSMSFLYASLCTGHTISCKSCCTLCHFLEDWLNLTELSSWRLDRNYSATEPERSEISGQFFRFKTTFSIIKTSRTSLKRYRKQAATCLQYTECAAGLTSTFC